MRTSNFVLETQRLRLRPFRAEDIDAVASILCDAETMRYYPRPLTRVEAERWIERNLHRYEQDGHGLWAMVEKETGEFIGNCGLAKQWVDGREEIEVGWMVVRRLWNKGLATEAARACRDHGFDALGLDRLVSMVRPENVPSRRVAEKIGMTVEKELVWGKGNFLHLVYAISKERRAS